MYLRLYDSRNECYVRRLCTWLLFLSWVFCVFMPACLCEPPQLIHLLLQPSPVEYSSTNYLPACVCWPSSDEAKRGLGDESGFCNPQLYHKCLALRRSMMHVQQGRAPRRLGAVYDSDLSGSPTTTTVCCCGWYVSSSEEQFSHISLFLIIYTVVRTRIVRSRLYPAVIMKWQEPKCFQGSRFLCYKSRALSS